MNQTETDIDGRIGARVRQLRIDRDLTLDRLSQRADVSRAMLSRIERGESSPTAQLLVKICGALGISLSALFAAAEAPSTPVVRRANQPTWRDPESGYLRRNISPRNSGSAVELVEVEFPAGGSVTFDNRHAAGTDQHIWVLDGVLELTLGNDVFELTSGDCMMMRLGQPTTFRNPASRPVRYAVILCHTRIRP
jgi:transcriptional regulator with XRE-family HTH domain